MKLFISYSHKDRTKVEPLVNLLKGAKHDVWFDDNLEIGFNWKDQLLTEIQQSDIVVLALTPNWVMSEWCEWEAINAIRYGKRLIPVLIEKTESPLYISEIQRADFVDGFKNKSKIQRFLRNLKAVGGFVPYTKVDKYRSNPEGNPERAIKQEINITSVTGGEVTIVAEQYVEAKQRDWNLPVVVGLVLAMVTLVVGVVAILPDNQRNKMLYSVGLVPPTLMPSITPLPTSTLTSTPNPTYTPMPSMTGEWNVAVARFSTAGGQTIYPEYADLLSSVFFNRLDAEMGDLSKKMDVIIQVRSPEQTGSVDGTSIEERATNAEQLAQEINADVIVYGTLERSGDDVRLQPEFYINVANNYEAEDVAGQYSFGSPIELIGNNETLASQINLDRELSQRSQAMSLIARGLSLYFMQLYDDSLSAFQHANDETYWSSNSGREVIYQLEGNSAAKAFMFDKAENAYQNALKVNPDYARAYGGLGNIFYSRSVQNVTGQSYTPDIKLLEKATEYYHRAITAKVQSSKADVSTKVAFGLGQVFLAQWFAGMSTLPQAVENFNIVIQNYDNGTNKRLQEIAAESHARLGLVARQQVNTDIAIQEFSLAVELSINPARKGVYWATLGDLYTTKSLIDKARTVNGNAIKAYRLAISLTKDNTWRARYWNAMATCYRKLGQIDDAKYALKQAMDLSQSESPDYVDYQNELSQLESP